jgi:hypothetical protein
MPLNTAWVTDIKDSAQKKELERTVAVWINTPAGKKFIEIMAAKQASLESRETLPDYDCPSWSHRQAHNNGYRQCILDVLKLLSISED